jgi:hypothetical protein
VNTKEAIERDGQILVEDVIIRSQFAKIEMCKSEPMSDNPAIMLIAVESNETNPEHDTCVEFQQEVGLSKPYHLAMIPLIHKEDVVDCIEDVVKAMPIAKFDFIILAVEGYTRSFTDPEEGRANMKNMNRGDLQKEFQENPFTDVCEAHVITAINWGADKLWHSVAPYKYDDQGIPQFSEPKAEVCELKEDSEFGRIPDTLIAICQYMEMALRTSEYQDLLARARKDGK